MDRVWGIEELVQSLFGLRLFGSVRCSTLLTVTTGKIEVVVPEAATADQIAAVLNRRREWLVSETRRLTEKARATSAVVHFTTGAKIPFRGRKVYRRSAIIIS